MPAVLQNSSRQSSKERPSRHPSKDGTDAQSSQKSIRQASKEKSSRQPSRDSTDAQSPEQSIRRQPSSERRGRQTSKDSTGENTSRTIASRQSSNDGGNRKASKDSTGRTASRQASKESTGRQPLVEDSKRRSTKDSAGSWWKDSTGGFARVASQNLKSHRSTASCRSVHLSNDGMLEIGFMSSHAHLMDADAERKFVRQRRGEVGMEGKSRYDLLDEECDRIVEWTTDCYGCLERCTVALCKDGQKSKLAVKSSEQGEDRQFGLRQFAATGYTLAQQEDATVYVDTNIPQHLGLRRAVHKSTSIERYCYRQAKAHMPATVGKDQINKLARLLEECDHANVLKCHEVCEDDHYIYLLYEYYSCVTLFSVLEHHSWTQAQIVNLVRECCAAVAYCTGMSLHHLGWTLCHVLLPLSCLEDPKYAKVYGFGLTGVIHSDSRDCSCWGPEAMESYLRVGEAFVSRLESWAKVGCDLWSLGSIIYAIIARKPPIFGPPEVVQELLVARKWSISHAICHFDIMDTEAKELVEQLMHKDARSRISADKALFNPWIRRNWAPHRQTVSTFLKLEKFCSSPLANRLFGCFLVKFLDSGHMVQVADAFYSLDSQGYGTVDPRGLRIACKDAGYSHTHVATIMAWMCRDGHEIISLSRFAESMAEEVIDGRALRHSFESLDDDGSQEISADELFAELKPLSKDLTIEDIHTHIKHAEVGVRDGENDDDNDDKLDYGEYAQLFPGRVRRLKGLEDRVAATHAHARECQKQLESVSREIYSWIQTLQEETKMIDKLGLVLSQPGKLGDEGSGAATVKEVRRHFDKLAQMLAYPPGPSDIEKRAAALHKKKVRLKRKSSKGNDLEFIENGFDIFLQDHAIHAYWPTLLEAERKSLKLCVEVDPEFGVTKCDIYKAGDAVHDGLKKIDEVLDWTHHQLEEYESFVDVMLNTEAGLHNMVYSGRGLPKMPGECDD